MVFTICRRYVNTSDDSQLWPWDTIPWERLTELGCNMCLPSHDNPSALDLAVDVNDYVAVYKILQCIASSSNNEYKSTIRSKSNEILIKFLKHGDFGLFKDLLLSQKFRHLFNVDQINSSIDEYNWITYLFDNWVKNKKDLIDTLHIFKNRSILSNVSDKQLYFVCAKLSKIWTDYQIFNHGVSQSENKENTESTENIDNKEESKDTDSEFAAFVGAMTNLGIVYNFDALEFSTFKTRCFQSSQTDEVCCFDVSQRDILVATSNEHEKMYVFLR